MIRRAKRFVCIIVTTSLVSWRAMKGRRLVGILNLERAVMGLRLSGVAPTPGLLRRLF
jgi:hypothetical protein